MRAKSTNETCEWLVGTAGDGACGAEPWHITLPNGDRLRVNTPYCETHAREFHSYPPERLSD